MKNGYKETKINYTEPLPNKWTCAAVEEVGKVITGNTPSKSKKEYFGKDYPFFKPADLNSGYYVKDSNDGLSKNGIKVARLLPERSILVTCIGATIGKTGFTRRVGASNQQINAIIPRKNIVVPEYLYFLFISPIIQKTIIGNASSTTLPILNKSKFEKILLPVSPLNEQKRIVSKLEELFTKLDAGIEYLKKTKILLKQYYQSLLRYAFEGKLTERWRAENTDKTNAIPFSGPEVKVLYSNLPREWKVENIGNTVRIIDYRGRTPPYSESGVPHLRSNNIRNGKVVWEELKYVSEDTYRKYMTRGIPKIGDLLFTTEGPLGEVSPVPEVKFSIAQRIMILRPSNEINFKFLMYQIMSERFRAMLYTTGTGSTIKGISSRNFKPLKICIAPIQEQLIISKEIEEQLSIIDNSLKNVNVNLSYCIRLRQSILKTAFEGKLVPQDPNDEPSESLLQRVKEERSNFKITSESNKTKIRVDNEQRRLI